MPRGILARRLQPVRPDLGGQGVRKAFRKTRSRHSPWLTNRTSSRLSHLREESGAAAGRVPGALKPGQKIKPERST